MIGQTLGHYRIEEKLGEGGMGVVYKAEDTQLGRPVAIKLLPAEYAHQQDRLQRFLSEAKLASSINHPNIVSIYELGEHGGQRFIAMEYVPGQSLRALLGKRSLALKKLLELALPVAEALARAHRAGVLHRDLKPENLLVSPEGYIKVADFGLAKLKPSHRGESTLTEQVQTDAGKVVGTVAYMSPEQLQGQELDGRSDVFSFGAVLYEMATGKSPFLRGSAASTTAAILRDSPPPVRSLAGTLPAELESVIQKALEKEPDFRYQSMDELAADLRRLRRELESGRLAAAAAAPLTASRWGRVALWAGGAALLATILVLGALLWRRPGAPPATSGRVVQLTALPGLEDSPTWSPDGRSIAYVSDAAGNLDIYVQQIGGGPAIRLTGSDADDAQPAWSPDGSRIAFVSARAHPEKRLSMLLNLGALTSYFAGGNGDIWVMPALGGPARRVAENAYFPAWAPDGKKLVYQASRGGRWDLWVQEVDAATEPRVLAMGRFEATVMPVITQPAWSPDGNWIAFTAGLGAALRIYAVPSPGGEARPLTEETETALMPIWSPDGRWFFFSSNRGGQMNLWKARFEDGRLGKAEQLTTGSGQDLGAQPDPTGKRLAYSSVRSSADLWEYDLKSGRATPLTAETTLEDNGRPSPDNQWLAFTSNRLGGYHLWLLNRRNGTLTQVTSVAGPGPQLGSAWSRDGQYLFYSAPGEAGAGSIWQYEVALGSTRKVYEAPIQGPGIFCVSSDNRYLVVPRDERHRDIVRVELSTGKTEVLTAPTDGLANDPACAPDGHWVAFHLEQGNQRKIWVVPFGGGAGQQITFGEGEDSHPAWSADSRSIYFLRDHHDIYVVPRTGGQPRQVTHYGSFSTSLDYPATTADGAKLIFTRIVKAGDIYLLESPAQ